MVIFYSKLLVYQRVNDVNNSMLILSQFMFIVF